MISFTEDGVGLVIAAPVLGVGIESRSGNVEGV